jgi:hypothetical protein
LGQFFDRELWALFFRGGEGFKKHAFCETNPFVMLANSPLRDVRAISYVDYTKMTNGFVFGEIGCGDGGNGRDGARPSKVGIPLTLSRLTVMREVRFLEGNSLYD